MSVPCLFAIEFGVLEFWLCRSVLKHFINKRNQSQGLPIDISVQLQACFCTYTPVWCSKWKPSARRVIRTQAQPTIGVRCLVPDVSLK